MQKADLLLAALASGNVETSTPADVQRLLFLISRQMPEAIDDPPFKFVVCDYGPFDPRVYGLLEELAHESYVSVERPWRAVALTPAGKERAAETLARLPAETVDYMCRACRFVVAKSTRTLAHIADRVDTGSSEASRLRLVRKDRE